jgi:hypothetical protein
VKVTAVNTDVMMDRQHDREAADRAGTEIHHQRGAMVLVILASKIAVDASL